MNILSYFSSVVNTYLSISINKLVGCWSETGQHPEESFYVHLHRPLLLRLLNPFIFSNIPVIKIASFMVPALKKPFIVGDGWSLFAHERFRSPLLTPKLNKTGKTSLRRDKYISQGKCLYIISHLRIMSSF